MDEQRSAALSNPRDAFRRGVEGGDVAAMVQALAPDIVFHSPIVHNDYVGRESVAPLLAAVVDIFQDFRYVAEFANEGGKVLRFHARIGTRELDGVDILEFDASGLIRQFSVMVRPYSAATALRDAMAAKLAPAGAPPTESEPR